MLQGTDGDCCPFSTGFVEIVGVEVGKKKDEVCKKGKHGEWLMRGLDMWVYQDECKWLWET